MALNIAVPLSGCGDLLDEFNLLSPILPMNIDSRDKLKILCSPIGSESSGVSSLDSEEIKKSSTSSSPVQERGLSVSSSESTNAVSDENTTSNEDDEIANDENGKSHLTGLDISSPILASPKPKHPGQVEEIVADSNDAGLNTSAVETIADDKNDTKTNENDEDYYSIEKQKKMIPKTNYVLNGRNILNLGGNLANSGDFVQYTRLPESNLKMFLANRSQYHRLGNRGHIQEYALAECTCCDFIYPVSGYNNNTSSNDNLKNVNVNAYAKQGGGLAAAILAGVGQLDSYLSQMASPPNNNNQHYMQKNQMAQHTAAHPPTINELLNTNYQQQQQMATIAALLSATNKENTLNSLHGCGNNNITTALNRILGHNNNNPSNNGNWDTLNAILNNSNNYNSNGVVQTKNYHHYSPNQVVPPSNYGYYKQF